MYILRSYRGISRLLQRYPIVDRTSCSKGGDSGNVYIFQRFHKLVPFTCSTPPCQLHASNSERIHRSTFSTSKTIWSRDLLSQSDLKKAVDNLTDQFMEARELLDDARESVGSVYFSGDMEEASEAVSKTLKEYQELLSKLSDGQKQEVLRSIGLKMKELEAQQSVIVEEL